MNDPEPSVESPGALGRLWDRLLAIRGMTLLILVLGVNAALIVVTNQVTLRDFENSADEYAYMLSARLFASGRLSVPSPEPREFFTFTHVLNDGKFYGKYPPGWPLLLAVGVLLKAPWLINLLLGSATLLLVYRTATESCGDRVGKIALLSLLASPFLVFNSASYFSHPACLFAVALFTRHYLRCLRNPEPAGDYIVLGLAAGMVLLLRPFVGVGAIAPLGIHLLVRSWKSLPRPALAARLALGAAPLAACAGLFCLYNQLQTGDFRTQPFTVYDPEDTLGFSPPNDDVGDRFLQNVVHRLLDLNLWVPLSTLFVILFLARRESRGNRPVLGLLAIPAGLLVSHFFYWGHGGNQYGPRYLYESLGVLTLVSAVVIESYSRRGILLLASILILNGVTFFNSTTFHAGQVRERMKPFDLARERGLRQAIVFLKSGSGTMPPGDLTRNGLTFDSPVLFVHNLEELNPELLRRFPDRTPYDFEYDRDTAAARLTPRPPGNR